MTLASRSFAAAGALSFMLLAYLIGTWIASGDATPTPTGPDPVPDLAKLWAWMWQALGVVLLVGCVTHLVRTSRGQGRLTFDALVFIAWTSALWIDPVTNNFLEQHLLYNSYLLNLGSWGPHVPGWQSPNGELLPHPLVAYAGIYGASGLLVSAFGAFVMRSAARRYPGLGPVGLVLCCFACIALFDLLLENLLIRADLWSYAGAIHSLSLWGGGQFQFPLYEPLLFGAVWTATSALRYFRDRQGRSLPERGIDETRLSPRRATILRILTVTGYVHLLYLAYSAAFSAIALLGGPFPDDLPSYLLNGMCGPGTAYSCP